MLALENTRAEEAMRAKELAWHINRGSHIRPLDRWGADPRTKGGTFSNENPYDNDQRLRGEEQNLLMEQNSKAAALEDNTAEKVMLNKRREAIEAQWKWGGPKPPKAPKEGKMPLPKEGTKLWYEEEIRVLKKLTTEEDAELKTLVDKNCELRASRQDLEARKKDVQKNLQVQLVKNKANQCRVPPKQIADKPAASSPGKRTAKEKAGTKA